MFNLLKLKEIEKKLEETRHITFSALHALANGDFKKAKDLNVLIKHNHEQIACEIEEYYKTKEIK